MKTKLTTFILFFSLVASATAQNARGVLDKAYAAYTKAGGITANFTLQTKDVKAKNTYSYDGTASMKGDKFKLVIPDGTTWFDGKTQWVYLTDTDEVNVSNPTAQELQGISPAALFAIYKSGFNLTTKASETVNGKLTTVVEMIPQKKNANLTKVTVWIDKSTNIFSRITVDNTNGLQNVLTIKKYQAANLPDATFVFNKRDYPKVEIIDLR